MNPVVLLDEVDKVGADWRGDPSSALLEVLDPAQNHTFRDHYLEVDLDLSDVLFIATANVLDTIPGPLLDRMEIIRLDGYTEDEKVAIARDHLLARQLERNGLRADEVVDHRRRAARRSSPTTPGRPACATLERELGKAAAQGRRAGRRRATSTRRSTVDADDVVGPGSAGRASSPRRPTAPSVPGVATGLAVTGAGGDVLFVEAIGMRRRAAGLTLTGQLGDVMKESARDRPVLRAVARRRARHRRRRRSTQARFHVHVPAGAVPKDGPSAGVTMTTALVSACSPGDRCARRSA